MTVVADMFSSTYLSGANSPGERIKEIEWQFPTNGADALPYTFPTTLSISFGTFSLYSKVILSNSGVYSKLFPLFSTEYKFAVPKETTTLELDIETEDPLATYEVNGLEEMSVYFIDEITIISEGSEKIRIKT